MVINKLKLRNPAVLSYALTLGLMIGCTALGFLGIGAARWIFMVGCVVLGYVSWKDSPGRNLEIVIILFAFSPFIRRVIDLGAGFDQLAIMLSGPLLAMLVPCTELTQLITGKLRVKNTGPFILAGVCILYAAAISLFTAEYQVVMALTLKWMSPLLYGLWIMSKSGDPANNIISHASRAFLIVTPVMGIYGVAQYIDPMPWDRYWMIYAEMNSIGTPEPYKVRVFSTMNSPASFATFATAGLIVFSFTRRGWQSILIGFTVALSLMLSQYRTAWIAMLCGIGYGFIYPSTRARSNGVGVCAVIAGILATTLGGPIGDVVSQRFDSLSQGSKDGSAVERISEFVDFYAQVDQYLYGKGLGILTRPVPGLVAVDGTVIGCFLSMGIIVGSLCLIALIWAAVRAIMHTRMTSNSMQVANSAVVFGMIITLPLAGITASESGFLFWCFVGIATAIVPQPLHNKASVLASIA